MQSLFLFLSIAFYMQGIASEQHTIPIIEQPNTAFELLEPVYPFDDVTPLPWKNWVEEIPSPKNLASENPNNGTPKTRNLEIDFSISFPQGYGIPIPLKKITLKDDSNKEVWLFASKVLDDAVLYIDTRFLNYKGGKNPIIQYLKSQVFIRKTKSEKSKELNIFSPLIYLDHSDRNGPAKAYLEEFYNQHLLMESFILSFSYLNFPGLTGDPQETIICRKKNICDLVSFLATPKTFFNRTIFSSQNLNINGVSQELELFIKKLEDLNLFKFETNFLEIVKFFLNICTNENSSFFKFLDVKNADNPTFCFWAILERNSVFPRLGFRFNNLNSRDKELWVNYLTQSLKIKEEINVYPNIVLTFLLSHLIFLKKLKGLTDVPYTAISADACNRIFGVTLADMQPFKTNVNISEIIRIFNIIKENRNLKAELEKLKGQPKVNEATQSLKDLREVPVISSQTDALIERPLKKKREDSVEQNAE